MSPRGDRLSAERRRESIDDLDALLAALPAEIVGAVHALPNKEDVIEVVLDLGRRPEARFPDGEITPSSRPPFSVRARMIPSANRVSASASTSGRTSSFR